MARYGRRFLIAVGGHWAGALLPLLLGSLGLDVLRLLFLLGGLVFPPYLLFYASLAILATVSLLLIWGTLCAVVRVTRYTIPVHKKASTLFFSTCCARIGCIWAFLSMQNGFVQCAKPSKIYPQTWF